MIIQYNIVVTIVNLIDNSTSRFNKIFETEVTAATDALLYNNYHILSNGVYVLDMFEDEVNAYCTALGIERSSVEVDEFEIVGLSDRVEVFFESNEEDNSLSLKPTIKCYIHPRNDALKIPKLVGVAYDSTTIIWSWPEDEQYAHYLVEEAIDLGSESDQRKIIAQLPIGATSYTETGLTPDTPYTRRLINYTDEQTSAPSASVTVITETVEVSQSLEEYNVPKNYDFTSDDAEREIIEEHLEAFHSGIGDGNDLRVYKQMDADFYQKFKAYLELTGKRVEREKHYDQVGFNYKICLEALETVEEQEGEVTFDLDAYPREDVSIQQYMFGTMPVGVYAKLYATIFLRKAVGATEPIEVVTLSENWSPGVQPGTFYGNPLNVVFVLDKTNSLEELPFGNGGPIMKAAVKNCIDTIESLKGSTTVRYCIIQFAKTASRLTNFTDAASAKAAVDSISINGGATSWAAGLDAARSAITGLAPDGKFVTYFFSDGFPNTDSSGAIHTNNSPNVSGARHGVVEGNLRGNLASSANALKGVCEKVACLISNYGGGDYVDPSSGVGYKSDYINYCHSVVPTSGGQLTWNDSAGMQRVFIDYIQQFSGADTSNPIFGGMSPSTTVIYQPYDVDQVKAVQVETELIGPFNFDRDVTPIYYSQKEKRAIIDKDQIIAPHTQVMTPKSVYDLILDAARLTPEWAAGYNQTIGTTDGSYLIKGLFIKDTYAYADEDVMDDNTFDVSNLEDGKVGSVNVYTDISTLSSSTFGDDCYLVSTSNYVYIDGYTDGIIYDGTRFVTTELNAYDHALEVLIDTTVDYRGFLLNRKNKDFVYSGLQSDITSVIKILERGDDIWLEGYDGLVKAGDEIMVVGINSDLIAHNDTYFESPILNYRFNLEDPDAKTPFYEILPTCNPESKYLHIVVLHVYYAKNVFITNPDNYVDQFSDDPIATTSSEYIPLVEDVYQWTQMYWKHDRDNGRYIDEYLWFMAKPMLKTQDYYDELPGIGMETFYGLVNGRYRDDNQSGKEDLIVDTPQFNIPTTVHDDTIRIYILITEFYPETALVSYKWEHPLGGKDSITNVNGDYVTFSSDSLTYKDMEYYDVVSTINMENQEIFDNKATERIFEIAKPSTVFEYDNYYLAVTTDNSDVLAMRYPTEITFDEDGLTSVGVTFKGVVNATSRWSPRIHNGYYYLNQHEHFAYSEFDVDAKFDVTEEKFFKKLAGYITFDVYLRRIAAPAESYLIIKDVRSELLQNENEFQWVDGKGVTLKPSINGVYFREYLPTMYCSPVILFPNVLTEAGPFKVDYTFDDGSDYLQMDIRSYILEEGKWSDWTPFENNTVPTVPLSCGYQVRIHLQASVLNNDFTTEDYLCCYLDWKDEIDEVNTTNIVTVTDHMISGPDEAEGIFVSKIIDFGCDTELMLDIFESYYKQHIQLFIAYTSQNPDVLLLENIEWHDISQMPDVAHTARWFRYKVVIPPGEKMYWLHKRIKTLETHEILPYISGVSMTGTYAPSDITTNFMNTEAFELPRDGEFHTLFRRVSDVIGADVLLKGFTLNEVEYVKIQCTTENIELSYDPGLDTQFPTGYLNKPVSAMSSVAYDIVAKNTPYILVDANEADVEEITIRKNTPQQYCPITIEDEYGHTYQRLYDVDPATMYVTDVYIMESKEKYIELKRNDFELETVEIYLNGVLVTPDCYKIVNHLLIFNDFLMVNDKIEVKYRIAYSFYADIDRINDITKLTLYMDKQLSVLPDIGSYNEPYEAMSVEEMYLTGQRFSCTTSSDSLNSNPSEETSWAYDSTLGTFMQTVNSVHFNGFISNREPIENYVHEVTIKSKNSDDDVNGVVVGYALDEDGNPHTLTYVVSREGVYFDGYAYALVYDYHRPTQDVLCGSMASIDPTFGPTKIGWSSFSNGIRVHIEKIDNVVTCKTSMWNDPTTWNPASEFSFHLDSNYKTQIFSGPVQYGYCNLSQANSYYTDIYFQAFIVREIKKRFKVYFETDKRNNKFIASELSLNPIYRTDYKGFIYLTDEHNEPYTVKIYCNPLRLKAGGYDKVDVSIEVLDIQNNPVISKEVAVDCEYGILNCESYVTDMNGVVHLVYESAYLPCTDTLTVRVLKDDETVLEQSISIINE